MISAPFAGTLRYDLVFAETTRGKTGRFLLKSVKPMEG